MHAESALVCLEMYFGSQLVEYERNVAERTWQEVEANRAEVTSALEAVAANNAQLLPRETLPSNSAIGPCDRRRAWNSTATVHTLPWRHRRTFSPTLRLASLRFAISSGSSLTMVFAEWNNMPASTEMFAEALREESHRELISVEDSNDLLDSVRISSCVNEVTCGCGCCEKLLPKIPKKNVNLSSVRLASKFQRFRI